MRRLLMLVLLTLSLLIPLGSPAQAHGHGHGHGHGDVYSREHYSNPYSFTDDGCDITFDVVGHARGFEVIYNVPGSDGQAFLDDNRYRYREVWTNPENGRKAYVSGRAHYQELFATHLHGDVWKFITSTTGAPFTVRNDHGKVVLAEHGRLVTRQIFDTLGDSQPGGELLDEKVLAVHGSFPTWEPDFDFCEMVTQLLG
jgi:hypothetical protein